MESWERCLPCISTEEVSLTPVRLTRGLEFLLKGLCFRHEAVVKQKGFGDLQMSTVRTVWL